MASVLARFALASAFLALLAAPASAQKKKKSQELYTALDDLSQLEDPLAEIERVAKLGQPDELLKILKKGRPGLSGFKRQAETVELIDELGRKTELTIFYPSSRPPRSGYGVVLALHGLNGNGAQMLPGYTALAARQRLVILAPSAQKLPNGGEKGPSGAVVHGNEDTMGREMLQHWWYYRSGGFVLRALALLKRKVPVDTNRVFLTGYSMGGYGTWNLGLRYPDRFAGLAPLAGAISRRERGPVIDEQTRNLLLNARYLPMFIYHGAKDRTVPVEPDRLSRDRLEELGAPYVYVEEPNAGHSALEFWRNGPVLSAYQAWFGKQRRNPHPAVVEHAALGPWMGRSYWLELVEVGGRPHARAEIRKGNHIVVDSEEVRGLRIYLDPELVKLSQPVTVTWNGEVVFEGPAPDPTAEALVRSWLDREDPELCYLQFIDLTEEAKRQDEVGDGDG